MEKLFYLIMVLFFVCACGGNKCISECHDNYPSFSKSRCEEMCSTDTTDSGDTADSGDTGYTEPTDSGDTGYTDDEPYEPINDDDDWYLAAYEYIQECTSVGHSEEDCETWYFEY